MNRLLAPLLMRIAEMFDRSLLMVPEIDKPFRPPAAHSGEPMITGQSDPAAEWTRQIRRALVGVRTHPSTTGEV